MPSLSRTVILSIIFMLIAMATSAATPLQEAIANVRQFEPGPERTAAFYELVSVMETGTVDLDEATGEDLARLLIDVLLDPKSGHERIAASTLAEENAHPVMADPLVEYLKIYRKDSLRIRRTASAVLVRLHDSRILDPLVLEMKSSEASKVKTSIKLLVELGDPRAIPPMETLLADTTLAEKYGQEFLRRRQENDKETRPEDAERSGMNDAGEVHEVLRIALRQLRLLETAGISCGFDLTEDAMAGLVRDGFVILPHPHNEMYEVYTSEYPFVTTDFAWHTAMILIRAAIDEIETLWLEDATGRLAVRLAKASEKQSRTLESPEDRDRAVENTLLFAVPALLCGGLEPDDLNLSPNDAERLAKELELVMSGVGIEESPVLGKEEDYSEYLPRGRFSNPGSNQGYFRAVTWLGRHGFRTQEYESTRRGLLATAALMGDPGLFALWKKIDGVHDFLGGPPDDLAPTDFLVMAGDVSELEGAASIQAVLSDRDLERRFGEVAASKPAPRIHTGLDADRQGATGMRILGARYSRDAHLFQELMEDGVWPPSGLHVLAGLMGSARAEERLGGPVDFSTGTGHSNSESLMEGLFEAFTPALDTKREVPAVFMTKNWQDKMLNSAMGAWAETRHASAPYLKAAHQYMGLSGMQDRIHGFVEPYPEFFTVLVRHMAAWDSMLVQLGIYEEIDRQDKEFEQRMTEKYGEANDYGVRPRTDKNYDDYYQDNLGGLRLDQEKWQDFITILERLTLLAAKGRDGEPQDPSDGVFLKKLGDRMRRISFNQSNMNVAQESMARVIDVATETYFGEVLQVGVGRALPIFVVVSSGAEKVVCRGGVYSYYEFIDPISSRIDDETWRALSSNLTGPGDGPWLDQVGRIQRATMDRETLQGMKKLDEKDFRRGLNPSIPWQPWIMDHLPAYPWVGARAAIEDVDALIDLTRGWSTPGSIHLFCNEELARHSRNSDEALRYFHLHLDYIIDESESHRVRGIDKTDLMRLYFGVQALAASDDPENRKRLEEIREMLDSWELEHQFLQMMRKTLGFLVDRAMAQKDYAIK